MKASRLIEQLQTAIQLHGDHDVVITAYKGKRLSTLFAKDVAGGRTRLDYIDARYQKQTGIELHIENLDKFLTSNRGVR